MKTNTAEPRVGVVGLGIMGGAFAGHLAAAGVHTIGYDVLPDRMHELTARGVHPASSAQAIGADADIVITSLPSVKAFEQALFGNDGLAAGARSGLLVVETSTLPLDVKESTRRG